MNRNPRSVLRRRAPMLADGYGDDVRDWGNAVDITLSGVSIAPTVAENDNAQGRQGTVIGWDLYAPKPIDVAAGDRIVVDGNEFDIVGDPAEWDSRSGAVRGVVVPLIRKEG